MGALSISSHTFARQGGQAERYYGPGLRLKRIPAEGCASNTPRRPSSEQYKKNNNGTLTHAHSLDRLSAPGGARPRRLVAGRATHFGSPTRPRPRRGPALLPARRWQLQRLGSTSVEHRRLQRQCDRNQLGATARGGGNRPRIRRALPHPAERRRQLPEPDHAQGRREGRGRRRGREGSRVRIRGRRGSRGA